MVKLEKIFYNIIYKVLKIKLNDDIYIKLIQFIKFGIVGLGNTFISYFTYVLLVSAGLNYILSSIIGFIVSVINAFYWNNKYVFTERHNTRVLWKTFLKTLISYSGTGLLLANLLLFFWVDIIRINQITAPILNLFITIPINFILNKFWAFKESGG